MQDSISKLLNDPKCLNKNVLPALMKDEHPLLTGDNYHKNEWKVTVINTGALKTEKYHRLYCTHCLQPSPPKINRAVHWRTWWIENGWSINQQLGLIKHSSQIQDYIGCFLPWKSDVFADLNSRSFIREQSEHPKTTHIFTVDSSKVKPTSNKLKRQSTLLSSASATATPKQKVIVLDDDNLPSEPNPKQSTFSAKQTKKHLKQGDLNELGNAPNRAKSKQRVIVCT